MGHGTKLSDQQFFNHLLRTDLDGLTEIPHFAEQEDYASCRKILAAYIRSSLKPELFFSKQQSMLLCTSAVLSEKDYEEIEHALHHIVTIYGITHDYGENPIDWITNYNPAEQQYGEWIWGLNRHLTWRLMARAYRENGDEKYAEGCAEQMRSWIDQAQFGVPVIPYSKPWDASWRTLETGLRMGDIWPEILHTFLHCPAFDDDLIADICKSIWEHGDHLRKHHRPEGNWLIQEMIGLTHIGILFPCLTDSKAWLRYALEILEREALLQVYPDGFQTELSISYHQGVLMNYAVLIRLLTAYGYEINPTVLQRIQKMLLVYIHLMMPDGNLPQIGDGDPHNTAKELQLCKDIYPNCPEVEWAASERKQGTPPAETSHIFENSGLASLRTGWTEDDTWMFFDGGKLGTGHQHEDKLQVLFYADHRNILVDPGRCSYDTSMLRNAYCTRTSAHNTILVDGLGQHRFPASEEELEAERHQYIHIDRNLTPEFDAVHAVYDEGYGPENDTSITHDRAAYFLKKPAAGLRPFAIIADRLTADRVHDYSVLWHLNVPTLSMNGMNIRAATLNLMVPDAPQEILGLTVSRAQQTPVWQGWAFKTYSAHNAYPIYTAAHTLHTQNIRWITVLYPDSNAPCPIEAVEAPFDLESTLVTLRMKDGSVLHFDEKDFWPSIL